MKALVITLPPERWLPEWPHHWHVVDSAISRHVVTAVQSNYVGATVTEYEWEDRETRPTCAECGEPLR